MKASGINSADVKKLNRLTVLKYLSQNKGISRMELTANTGLTKMTISNIITEFIDKGLLEYSDHIQPVSASAGRKPAGLQFTHKTPVIAGLWISRDGCTAVITNLHLSPVKQESIPFENENTESLETKLLKLMDSILSGIEQPLLGIGVASIGPLDMENGILLNPPNFFHITVFKYRELFEKKYNCPVFVQNDMNAAALAENYFGICKDVKNFAYVGLSNGIGSGIIVNNELFEGSKGFAGEIGHMIINYSGPKCHCGNCGCLETYLNITNLIEAFEARFSKGISRFSEIMDFCKTSQQGQAWLKEQMDILTIGLVNMCNTVDPHIIVMGHEAALLDVKTLDYIEKVLNDKILASGFTNIKIVRSSFGNLAPVMGASAIVLEKLFKGKLELV